MAVGPGYFSVAFVVAKEADAMAKKQVDGEGNIRKRKDRRPGGENTASGPRFYPVWGTVWVNCKFCKIAPFLQKPLEATGEEKPCDFARNQTVL